MMLFVAQVKAIVLKNFQTLHRDKSALRRDLSLAIIAFGLMACRGTVKVPLLDIIQTLLVVSFNTTVLRGTIIDIVEEKTDRYKETFRIMGMNISSYFVGWLTTTYLKCFILTVVLIAGMLIGWNGAIMASVPTIIVYFVVFLFASTHMGFFLSTFFSNPKTAGEASGFIMSLFSILYIVAPLRNDFPLILFNLTCLLPHASFGYLLIGRILRMDLFTDGYKRYDLDLVEKIAFGNIFLYLLLFLYCDQVFPNEYGLRRSPFFFITDLLQKKTRRRSLSERLSGPKREALNETGLNVALKSEDNATVDYSSAIFHENIVKKTEKSMLVRNIAKEFGKVKAVDGVSFDLYEGEIFCLLGHNGAGKTTTINLLTGLQKMNRGSVNVFGFDLEKDLQEVRSIYGLCPQKDTIYLQLTVEDHLNYIGRIRGIPSADLEKEVNLAIEQAGLTQERKKTAGELSGGNKRKLCLGMAILGGSKIIFLDEPSSGMDPVSRRLVWESLKRLREQNKTILLTTHHLEEAEALADRISIMSKGKLLILGSSDFIKRKYGIGYRLVVSPETESNTSLFHSSEFRERITTTISTVIPDSSAERQTTEDYMVFTLPFASQSRFPKLFSELEAIKSISVSLEMTSLEDAFVNIGLEESREGEGNVERVDEMITVPKSFKNAAKLSFCSQVLAMFIRKAKYTYRSPLNMVMTLLPLAFIIIAILIASKMFKDDASPAGVGLAMSILSIFQSIAFAINSSIYTGFPVFERERDIKYVLKVVGCSSYTYWLGTFAFDILCYCFLIAMMLVAFVLNDTKIILNVWYDFLLLAVCFGWANLTSCYLLGFLFRVSASAYKYSWVILYFGTYIFPNFLQMLAFSFTTQGSVLYIILDVCASSIFPCYQFGTGITYLSPGSTLGFKRYILTSVYTTALVMAINGAVFLILTLVLEDWKYSVQPRTDFTNKVRSASEIDDVEVHAEEKRVLSMLDKPPKEQDAIVVSEMTKIYDNGYKAVDNISFANPRGQIFGLLGPNGAGKSTTFSVITARLARSHGHVKLNGMEVASNLPSLFKDVGICPQFNPLWDTLTVKEHLYIFGRLKGLGGKVLEEQVEYLIRAANLTEYIDRQADNLSGGNKRKLCVAITIIGGSTLQFFDEPSSGVDPFAKRFLWNLLTQSVSERNSSIILTTHSMAEAESLCTKIGILINGKFVCLGTLAHLKNKYGKGFQLTIKTVEDVSHETIEHEIKSVFPSSVKNVTSSHEYVSFSVKKRSFRIPKHSIS